MKIPFRVLIILIAIVFLATGIYVNKHQNKTTTTSSTKAATTTAAGFNKQQYSLTDPTSIWVIVNKHRPLPENYIPTNLVVPSVPLRLDAGAEQMHVKQVVEQPLEDMFAAAKTSNVNFMIASGYRSAAYQTTLYAGYVASEGQAEADTLSARPNFSEHESGYAVDLDNTDKSCELEECFGNTPGGKWLVSNAYKYGFVIRYQQGKTPITGYAYEPWHVRYVGKDLAAKLQSSGQSLEEFFGLSAAPDYL